MTPQMDAETLLREMLALFEGGERWTTQWTARDANGIPVSPNAPEAQRFCLVGAAIRIMPCGTTLQFPAWVEAQRRLERATGISGCIGERVHNWNDRQEHFGPVKAALLAALEDGK